MPDRKQSLSIRSPRSSAAGARAVLESIKAAGKAGLARGVTALRKANQPDGFDCPGCAWPDDHFARKRIDFCENGAKAIADEATGRTISANFFAEWSVARLARQSDRWLNERGRLAGPVVKRPGSDHYEPIDWDDVFALIAQELRHLSSPDEAVFYTSGRTSNEAAFLYQLLARMYGTNNLPDSSNLCHESSGMAMLEALGSGKGTVSLDDFDRAGAIFIFGQNPGSNHPRMLATLQKAHRRGAKIVSINPLAEAGLMRFRNPQEFSGYVSRGTSLADLHVPVRVNGDVALLKGLCKALFEADSQVPGSVIDTAFVEAHTTGFEAFQADIEATPWNEIVTGAGVNQSLIRAAAQVAIDAPSTICCWAMGLTQHRNAVANVQGIVNFLLMRGNVGRPGAGACPVRGHSNVQGDRTMGITERPTAAFIDALGREFGFTPPTAPGLNAVEAIRAMHEGRARVFVALGGNFAAATPDTLYTQAALQRCRLTVQISTKLNRSHVVTGRTALILPVLGRTDLDIQPAGRQFVTCENSMGVVSMSRGGLAPMSAEMRSEVRVVAELGEALLGASGGSGPDWRAMADDYALIRRRIERVVPGFADFERRLRKEGRIVLPHAVRDQRRFATATKRAAFVVHPMPPAAVAPGCYLMTTIRSHDQFNTTVYSDVDRYRGVAGTRRIVFMSPGDVAATGLLPGSLVDLTSEFEGEQRRVESFRVVPYEIPTGCLATYYPECNGLVPLGHVAERSNTPAYKSVVVRVVPRAGDSG